MQLAFEAGFDAARPEAFVRGFVVGSLRAASMLVKGRGRPGTDDSLPLELESLADAVADDGRVEARADAAAGTGLEAVVVEAGAAGGGGGRVGRLTAEAEASALRLRAGDAVPVPEAGGDSAAETDGAGLGDGAAGAAASVAAGSVVLGDGDGGELYSRVRDALRRAAVALGGDGAALPDPLVAAVAALLAAA